MTHRKLLVTAALPYANGDIHIGHLVEYIQTDIFVRFQKLIGNDCTYICADDTHGTPIMVNAKKKGVSPEEFIAQFHQEHQDDFKQFGIQFDYYGSTHTEENRVLSEAIYHAAQAAGAIDIRDIDQLYDTQEKMFLPDRFVKGTCPKCAAEDQYGDSCEVCSAIYSPNELVNPKSVVSGESPITKTSTHYFFKVSQFESIIQSWLETNPVCPEIKNKLQEWFDIGLRDWDISRDEPYFGFKIPDTDNKFFYVWVDAPVGYISSTQIWAKANNQEYLDFWKNDAVEIHHFIGKDILYFHTLFWPAMLHVGGYNLPTKINIHGFLTVNGKKMSKSRGTFITAREFSGQFNPEFLRYYYAAKLSGSIEDIDFNLTDFMHKVNSDVLGKFINIASRLGGILHKRCGGKLTTIDNDGQSLLNTIRDRSDEIQSYYNELAFNKAMMTIMSCADIANKYIDENAPWTIVKEDPAKAAKIITAGLNACRLLALYLKPVLPHIVNGIETFLMISPLSWNDCDTTIENHAIQPYEHLASRLQAEDISCFRTINT
jgi:methionyl-tRNA synthetase